MSRKQPSDIQTSQGQRFVKAARQLGADEDEAAFKAKLAVIARQKPKDVAEPPRSKVPADKE